CPHRAGGRVVVRVQGRGSKPEAGSLKGVDGLRPSIEKGLDHLPGGGVAAVPEFLDEILARRVPRILQPGPAGNVVSRHPEGAGRGGSGSAPKRGRFAKLDGQSFLRAEHRRTEASATATGDEHVDLAVPPL